MRNTINTLGRRAFFSQIALGSLVLFGSNAWAEALPVVTVWKDPSCGCCGAWVDHLRRSGLHASVIETRDMNHIKSKRMVPAHLASCHTAEIGGYTIEGHVPADAIRRLWLEKPTAHGLAVPGMPAGSPGMEGGAPEAYDVVLFGNGADRPFARYIGEKAL